MMGGQTAIIIYPFVLSPFYRTGGSVRPAVLPIEPTSPPFSSKFSRSNQQLLTFKVQIYLPLLVALLKATLNRRSYTTAPQLAFCFSFVCNKQAPPFAGIPNRARYPSLIHLSRLCRFGISVQPTYSQTFARVGSEYRNLNNIHGGKKRAHRSVRMIILPAWTHEGRRVKQLRPD